MSSRINGFTPLFELAASPFVAARLMQPCFGCRLDDRILFRAVASETSLMFHRFLR